MAASALKTSAPQVVDHHVSRLVFCVSFAVFLVIALVAELLAMRWRSWFPGAEGEGSLIGGVKSAVYTFMSSIP